MIPDTCHLLEYTVLEITIYQCRMPIDKLYGYFYQAFMCPSNIINENVKVIQHDFHKSL